MKRSVKVALLTSVICIVLCGALVLGGTLAWFNDTATSGGNVIASGTLDVEMTWADEFDGTYANDTAIFGNDISWEPGYTAVKYIKLENKGSLAFKYAMDVTADGETASASGAKLSEVIDVYMGDSAISSRNDVTNMTRVGTLAELVADPESAAYGVMRKGDSLIIAVALKMQESAGNDYQGLSINNISVKVVADQYTEEADSFGSDYDANGGLPVAAIYRNAAKENVPINWISVGGVGPDEAYKNYPLEAAYTFSATEDASNSPYRDWWCDFYVSLDRDLTANQIFLGGSYGGMEVGFNVDDDLLSIGYPDTKTLPANTPIPLLGVMTGGMSNWTYESIATIVNEFGCGVSDINNALAGATFTVELRLVNPDDTDEYIVVSQVKHTFDEEVLICTDSQLKAILEDIKTNPEYWGQEVVINLAGVEFSGDHVINQYPQWNGIVGAGGSGNNYATIPDGAPMTYITFVGQAGTKFTGNVTIQGFGNASTGFANANATTTFQNITFDAANSVEANGEDYAVIYAKDAANNITFSGCTFQNATHVLLGTDSGVHAVGTINVKACTFNDGGCLSGYFETLNVMNTTVNGAKNGFINKSKAGAVTVTGCDVKAGKYFLRTSNSGVNMTVTNCDVEMYVSEGVADLVKFRGSDESATFTGCTITGSYTVVGEDANSTLTIN